MHKIRLTILLAAVLLLLLPVSASALRAGGLDTTFNAPKGYAMKNIGFASTQGHATAIQPDGKIVVVGKSDGANNDLLIVRYNINGTLDKSFGTNGVSTYGHIISWFSKHSVALQPDGKIVISGSSFNLLNSDLIVLRYNIDGTLDTSFGSSGIVTYDSGGDDYGNAIAVQYDGKIIVVGQRGMWEHSDILLLRYNADGALDTSFGSYGMVTYDSGDGDDGNAVAIQNDGKIVIVGSQARWTSTVLMLRYNTDGTLDTSFGGDGIVTYGNEIGAYGNAVAIQNDGKIVVSGSCSYRSFGLDMFILRYNSNGTLDKGFGADGVVKFPSNLVNSGVSVKIQLDGKIVLMSWQGGPECNIQLLRLYSNGILDKGFGNSGIVIIKGTSFYLFAFTGGADIQPDGKILVVGTRSNDTGKHILVARLNRNGTRDNSFNGDGIVTYRFRGGSDDFFNAVALKADGKVVVAGSSSTGSSNSSLVARYNSDGTLDATFGNNRVITYSDGYQSQAYGNAAAIQSDGKIIVAGESQNNVLVLRYNSDGTLDKSFNGNGILTYNIGDYDFGKAVAVQPDGKIVIAGHTLNGSDYNVFVIRLNSNGSIDTGFGNNGVLIYDEGPADTFAYAVTIQPDGKIIIAGRRGDWSQAEVLVLRYSKKGSLDKSFNGSGIVSYDFGNYAEASGMALQPDGKILITGTCFNNSHYNVLILRYNGDGTLDMSFNNSGIVIYDSGTYDSGNAVAIQSDGKIVVAGSHDEKVHVLRYDQTGTLDRSFGVDGAATYPIGSFPIVNAVAIQPDGKIVIAGYSLNPTNHSYDTLVMRIMGDAPPIAPSTLTVTAATPTAISLTWKDNSDNETGFRIERKQGGCESKTAWTQAASTEENTEGFTDTKLMPSFPYAYRVRAFNKAGGSVYSNCSSAMTLPIIH